MSEPVEITKLSLHPLIDATYTREQRPQPTDEGEFKQTPKAIEDSHFTDEEPVLLTDPRVLDVANDRNWEKIWVEYEDSYEDEHAERLAVLQANDQPEMTPAGEIEYAMEWEAVYSEEAARRQGNRTDLRPILDESRSWGRADEEACQHVSFGKSTFHMGKRVQQAASEGTWGANEDEVPQEVVEVAREEWVNLKDDPEYKVGTAHSEVEEAKERHERAKRWQQIEEREDVQLVSPEDIDTKPLPDPIRAFIWPGSKADFAHWIISRMPEHETYVEPFAGNAAVLLNKPPSHTEVLNDADSKVTNFFGVARDQRKRLEKSIQSIEFTEETHSKWSDRLSGGKPIKDRVLQAAVFFFMRHSQYLGKANASSSFDEANASSFYGRQLALEDLQRRLTRDDRAYFEKRFVETTNDQRFEEGVEGIAGLPRQRIEAINDGGAVKIENEDFEAVLREYDSEDTLAYLDPPYRGTEDQYPEGFNSDDHQRLVDVLNDYDGDWILSYGSEPPKNLQIDHVESPKDVLRGPGRQEGGKMGEEWLITNIPKERIGTFRVAVQAENALESDW